MKRNLTNFYHWVKQIGTIKQRRYGRSPFWIALLLLLSVSSVVKGAEGIVTKRFEIDVSERQNGYIVVKIPAYESLKYDEGISDGDIKLTIDGNTTDLVNFYSLIDRENWQGKYWQRVWFKAKGSPYVSAENNADDKSGIVFSTPDAEEYSVAYRYESKGDEDVVITYIYFKVYLPINALNKNFSIQVKATRKSNGAITQTDLVESTVVSSSTTFDVPTVEFNLSNNPGEYELSYNTKTHVKDGSYYRWTSDVSDTGANDTKGSKNYPISEDIQKRKMSFTYKVSDYQHFTVISNELVIPAYNWPQNFKAEDAANGDTKLSWTMNTPDGEIIDGDNFEIQRSTSSSFSSVEGIEENPKFEKNQKNYTVTDKTGSRNYNGTYYYRIRRSKTKNTWNWNKYVDTQIVKKMSHVGVETLNAKIEESNNVTIEWKIEAISNNKVLSANTKYILTRINNTTGLNHVIELTEDEVKAGKYVDYLSVYCNEYMYSMYLKPGSTDYPNTTVVYTKDKFTPTDAGEIIWANGSKGYYRDRTELEWRTDGRAMDQFIIERRIYNSGNDFTQIATLGASDGITYYTYPDQNCMPGLLYEYRIFPFLKCANDVVNGAAITTYGMKSPTGDVYGRITYENGQAVPNVEVFVSSPDAPKGKSAYLKKDAYLKTDSVIPINTGAFSMQAYAYPEDGNGVIMEYGSFKMGIANYKPYFSYNNSKVELDKAVEQDRFTQFTSVYTGDSLKLYVKYNDTLTYVCGKLFDDACQIESKELIIGDGFEGYVDEIRLWENALSEKEIESNYNRYLAGNEEGLKGYWRLDDNIEFEFYDKSYHNAIYNGYHGKMYGNVKLTSDKIPTDIQLGFRAYTDVSGNYRITGIPYIGSGTTYTLIPSYGPHQFLPLEKTVVIGDATSSFTVDFTDNSSFTVAGYVYYEDSNIPVSGVRFNINGITAMESNGDIIMSKTDGSFSIKVPVGKQEVKAVKQNHTFVNDGKLLNIYGTDINYSDNMAGVIFWDDTKVKLVGKIVGGTEQESKPLGHSLSKNNLGDSIQLTLSLENLPGEFYHVKVGDNYLDSYTDTVLHKNTEYSNEVIYGRDKIKIKANNETGEFYAYLIPEKFKIESVNITGWDNLLSNAVTKDLSNCFTESTSLKYSEDSTRCDTVYFNEKYELIKRVSPSLSFYQVTDSITLQKQPYFGGTKYTISRIGQKDQTLPLYDSSTNSYLVRKPVFIMGMWYTFKFESYEEYVYNKDTKRNITDRVPTQGGDVNINNTISDEYTSIALNELGYGVYSFQASNPDISGSNKGIRKFQANSKVNNETTGNIEIEGYVLGERQRGNDFATQGPSEIIMVLRDPPGSKSYSFINKGITYTRSYTDIENGWFQEGEETLTHLFGLKVKTTLGIGAGVINEMESENNLGIQFKHREEGHNERATTEEITFTTGFQTSDDPEYVGADADVIIGNSTNIIIGVVDEITLGYKSDLKSSDKIIQEFAGDIVLYQGKALSVGKKFATLFAYPQLHIKNVLLPKLEETRNSYLLLPSVTRNEAQNEANSRNAVLYWSKFDSDHPLFGSSNIDTQTFDGNSYEVIFPSSLTQKQKDELTDSIRYYNKSIENWIKVLADNERIKAENMNNPTRNNYSFQAGAIINYTEEYNYSSSYTHNFSFEVGPGLLTQVGFTANGFGMQISASESAGGKGGYSSSTGDGISEAIGFVLAEEGSFDYLSVSVVKEGNTGGLNSGDGIDTDNTLGNDEAFDKRGGSFIFYTEGGATSCPYEGPVYTEYYMPGTLINNSTVKVEVPKIDAEPFTVKNVPSSEPAIFTLKMSNESEAKADAWYTLRLNDASNPNGAKLSIDGVPLSDGRSFLVKAGDLLIKTLEVKMGAMAYDYENLELLLHSQCQCDDIIDTVKINAHFVPGSTPVNIKTPTDKWVLNTKSNKNSEGIAYLPIIVDGFDVNYRNFDRIEVQYKPASESGLWTVLKTFYADSIKVVDPDIHELIEDATVSCNFVGKEDQAYDIRAVSYCVISEATEVSYESPIVSGVKDMVLPTLYGNTQPADGVLDIEDEIRLTFNEPIEGGYLTSSNIQVTAIKNGSQGDHSTSVSFNGESNFIKNEFAKNLAEKSLTIELWINPDEINREAVLFSHGDVSKYINFGLTADNRLKLSISKDDYLSTPIDLKVNEWAHVAAVVNNSNKTVELYYNADADAPQVLKNSYKGIGNIEIGRSINQDKYYSGKMHELRLWEKAKTKAKVKSEQLSILSGMEPALVNYYPMNEGKGDIVKDKARANNALMTASWATPEGFALSLDGNSYVAINSSEMPIEKERDFTMEFWFRADKSQGNAALICNGTGDDTEVGDASRRFFIGFENGELFFKNNNYKVDVDGDYLDNEWHHFALSVNRNVGNAQIFIDNELRTYFNSTELGSIAESRMYIGALKKSSGENGEIETFSNCLTGSIDEFRIWESPLTNSLISSNSNVAASGKELGLLAYYPFEEYVINPANQQELVFSLSDNTGSSIDAEYISLKGNPIGLYEGGTSQAAPITSTGPVQNIEYDFVTSEDGLIINLKDIETLEKSIVTFAVDGVRDVNGNELAGTIRWSAYINRNQLRWADNEVDLTIDKYKGAKFNARIVNNGGTNKSYTINGLPSWLSVKPEKGELEPQKGQNVEFTIDEGVNVGRYSEYIYLTGENGVSETMELTLKVNGEVPNWTVNPADFDFNMSVYGKIRINGVFSTDEEDLLAAFYNGECVGVANNSYKALNDMYYSFLTIYSKDNSSEVFEMRIYDASTGIVYRGEIDGSLDYIKFINDGIYGTPASPIIFDAKETIYASVPLVAGWNWVSFNVENENLANVPMILANNSWTNTDQVKAEQKEFWEYSSANGWTSSVGKAQGFDNISMFMIKSSIDQDILIDGDEIDASKTSLEINSGWNYISYLPYSNLTVKDALSSYEAQENDIIKSQNAFAMYTSATGWLGGLEYMRPGQGYMLLRNGGEAKLTYPYLTIRQNVIVPTRSTSLDNVNSNFSGNMTIVADVEGIEPTTGDMILAYVDGDIRGKFEVYNQGSNNLFFMTIGGEENDGNIEFRYQKDGNIISKSNTVINYNTNDVKGTISKPISINFITENGINVYPTVFSESFTVTVSVDYETDVMVQLFDMSGRMMWQSDKVNTSHGYASFNCTPNCVEGIYLVRVITNNEVINKKVEKK